jgi:hypothetical protein
MKKGLLTVLLASLVLVGCQNYDDQFDDLNAQISALKSQVDGLSSLSGQVSSLSGTISGLSSGVAAAQAAASAAGASADAATAAANAIDLSGLSASLATLQTEVDAVQASLATAATASAVTALQAELDAIEADLDDLLATSNIYSTDVSVTNATTLNAALALGNKLNVLNASLTITGYSGMSYANVQTLIDRVNTTTGNIVYTAASSLGTEVVFNNLVSAADITMTQPGGYHFPKLANAGTIDMKSTYETLVTRVNFPALTTATAVQTDASGTGITVDFTYATSVDFGAMVTSPSSVIAITTKKDAVLDLGAWVSKDASGNYVGATVTLNGPASFTNGTAAGTFASTGLPGNTLGAHQGTITLDNVATVAIHNFRGTIDINGGVKNVTLNNVVSADIAGAAAMESINATMIRNNTPGQSATTLANLDDSDDNTSQDLAFTSTHAKLTSATVTGKTGDITFTSVPLLTTVDLTGADAFVVSASGNASLTSWTDASKAEDRTFSDNDLMTSVSLSATTKLTATSDTGVAVTVNGNAELASLTLGMNSVDDLSISLNPKLATLAGATALTGNGTSTTVDVDIHQNAFVASSIKDTEEEIALASTAVGGTTDLGTITTTSGLKDLDAYITDAIAATGTVSVWFDTVTKLETQAAFGGTYTDVTADLTAPTAWDDTTAAGNADNFSGGYEGYYAYAFQQDGSDAVTSTSGARLTENITYTFDTAKAAASYADTALASNEGITIAYTGGNTTFKQGDTYNGSTVSTLDDLVAYINADTSLDGLGINLVADRAGYEKTLMTLNYTVSGDNGASNTTGTLSTVGNIWYTVNTTETGASSYISTTVADALGGTTSSIRVGLINALNTHNFGAIKGTNDNQIIVTRMISGGTSTDKSGLSSIVNVTPFIDDAQTSTTAKFLTGNVSNNAAKTSGNFAFTVTEEEISGIRITLRNTGSVAFASAVSLYGAAASNTAILTAGDGEGTVTDGEAKPNGTDRLLVSGTNVAAWTATYTGPGDLVTDYGDIAAGTTTTTTAAVTAVTTNRTGW